LSALSDDIASLTKAFCGVAMPGVAAAKCIAVAPGQALLCAPTIDVFRRTPVQGHGHHGGVALGAQAFCGT
jgi:hypothetical protein